MFEDPPRTENDQKFFELEVAEFSKFMEINFHHKYRSTEVLISSKFKFFQDAILTDHINLKSQSHQSRLKFILVMIKTFTHLENHNHLENFEK